MLTIKCPKCARSLSFNYATLGDTVVCIDCNLRIATTADGAATAQEKATYTPKIPRPSLRPEPTVAVPLVIMGVGLIMWTSGATGGDSGYTSPFQMYLHNQFGLSWDSVRGDNLWMTGGGILAAIGFVGVVRFLSKSTTKPEGNQCSLESNTMRVSGSDEASCLQEGKTTKLKIALISLLILAVSTIGFLFVMQLQAMTQGIICNNNLKRLGFALSLQTYRSDKFPPNWSAASKEITLSVKLHFLAGTEKSPLSSISLADRSSIDSNGLTGKSFYQIDSAGVHPDGGVGSQKAEDTTGLVVDATGTPALLVCPGDRTHSVAKSWEELSGANVTYEYIAQDAGISEPNRIVCVCQIHSLALLADGNVSSYAKHPEWITKRNGYLYFH